MGINKNGEKSQQYKLFCNGKRCATIGVHMMEQKHPISTLLARLTMSKSFLYIMNLETICNWMKCNGEK